MKRVKLLFIFMLLIILPMTVKGLTISDLPGTISTQEGVTFYSGSTGYNAYTTSEFNELHLLLDFSSDIKVEGSTTILLNDDKTIYNIKLVQSYENLDSGESESDYLVVPFSVTRQTTGNTDMLLDSIQVVGYEVIYDKKSNTYKAYVPSNVKETYVYAKVNGNATVVIGDGIKELTGKKTDVELTVSNPIKGDSKYHVVIIKKNYVLSAIIICSLIFIAIIGVILFFFKKYKDKVAIVNPNILKSGVSDLDIDAIIKDANKKKEINDISNETLENGVLKPRTLIAEEKK